MGIRARLTIGVTLTFALALSLGGVLLLRAVEGAVERAARTADRAALSSVEEQIERGVPFEELLAPAEAPQIVYLRGADGTVPIPPMPVRGADVLFVRSAPPPDGDHEWSFVSSLARPPGGAMVELVAARHLDEVRRTADSLARVLWIGIPLLLVLIAVTAWVVVGRALQPLDATLARLAEAARKQRRFTADASHELRSPVASIRTQLEVALAHPARVDWEELARGLLAEDRRLEAIVADLLLLARLDETAAPAGEPVDLDDVVMEEARRPRRVPVDASAVAPVRVRGRARELASLARNLVDNAARHARTRVVVALAPDGDGARLRVDDDGPGIPAVDRERVFERFTRLEEARSRDAGGVGLGLALVARIVAVHGGRVEVGEAEIGGARLEVWLPV